MTLFILKIIALVSMTVDHIGRFFFPDADWMTAVGRIAFPIFAWGVANGYRKSKDIRKYGTRLAIVGIISQIPYAWAFIQIGRSPYELNILFTLLLGLCAIGIYEKTKNKFIRNTALIALICFATIIDVSYGWYGVTLVLIFHTAFENTSKRIVLYTIATLGYVFLYTLLAPVPENGQIVYRGTEQLFSILALLPISLYRGDRGHSFKRLFYLYYPIHLAILALIYYYIN